MAIRPNVRRVGRRASLPLELIRENRTELLQQKIKKQFFKKQKEALKKRIK